MMKKYTDTPKVKKLSALDGWAIGSGAMIGASVFVVSGAMSGMAGPAAAVSFVLAAAITVIIALCFCEVSAAFPRSGGAYVYPKALIKGPLGEFLSFVSGMAFYGGQGLGSGALALTMAYYTSWSVELLGFSLPVPDTMFAVIVILFFGISNMIDTRLGNFFQLVSTFAVLGALGIFLVAGGVNVKTELWTPFMPAGFGAVLSAAAMGWAAYGGWSAIPNMAGEFKNPKRDVPLSMLTSLISCGIAFGAITLVMNGLLPYAQLGPSKAPVAEALSSVSKYGSLIIALGGIFAAISTLNGLMMSGSRIVYSMGREGNLPAVLARRNKRNGTPYIAVLITLAGMILLATTGLVIMILQMVVFVTVFSWIVTCCMLFVLRIKRKDITSSFRSPLFPITPIIAIGLSVFMLLRLPASVKLIGCSWLAFSALLFLLFNRTPLKKFCAGTPETGE